MNDEWEIDRLDLGGYLDRIGYDGQLAPDGPTLAALHRAHVAAVPFENVDVVLGRGVRVDLDGVQAKLVGRRRGGYCYEHGVLFAAVLTRLGFTVDRLLARIGDDGQRPGPRTHMTLRVRSGREQWLADVGFGAGLLQPLPWDQTGNAHQQGGWTYQLFSNGPGSWQLRERQPSGWAALYTFATEAQHASDVLMANHFTATHPSSPFVGQLVVMRKDDEVRRRLLGRRLTTVGPGGTSEVARMLDDNEVALALREEFGLPLSAAELDAVLAGLPADRA